jgi:hypothetical protein
MCFIPVIHADSVRTLYVSKTGNDANPGTKDAPFLTINKAAQIAVAGDTVLVDEGLYRETVKPKNSGTDEAHRITYKAKEGANVVIKGSEQITNWEWVNKDVWCVTLPNTFFGDYNPYNTKHPRANTGGFFNIYTCGDVYLNGEAYRQYNSIYILELYEKVWYAVVNDTTTTIYANFDRFNPNYELAEINVRHQIFAPDEWGLAYITVDGFTMMHAANWYSDYPSDEKRRQAGAISVSGGLKWIIQNNTIINARTIGIDIGLGCDGGDWLSTRTGITEVNKYGSHIIRNNYIAKCGQSGIAGVCSWNSQILNNRIESNNYRNEFSGAETAPIKLHYCNYGLIKGNLIVSSTGSNSGGIWADCGNQGMRVTGNIVINCPWAFYGESLHGPILVDNNIFISNIDIKTFDATGIVFANNLFANNGQIIIDGQGRVCPYYEPGTMYGSMLLSFPQKFFWYNNLLRGSTLPNNNTGKTHIKEGNSTTAITNFNYTVTPQEVTLTFDYNPAGLEGLEQATKDRVGLIPNANERIPANVDADYFGKPIVPGNVMAGPFQDIHSGTNTFKIWPVDRQGNGSGVIQLNQAEIKLYPNPFTDELHFTGVAGSLLRIINLDGKIVYTQNLVKVNETIYLKHLPVGIYICQLEKDNRTNTVKVLKK